MLDGEKLTDWAQEQWGDCRLGDARRTARLVKVGACMASRSSGSIPKQMNDWASTMGAYRLFAMKSATYSAVSSPHWERTRARASLPNQGLVLFVQDLTELDFGAKPDSFELGFVGTTYARGFEVQTTLCVLPSEDGNRPEVLGLALQTPWCRDHEPRKKIEKVNERAKRRTEYDIWHESVNTIGKAPPADSGTTWVSVGDKGSDIFAHLAAARDQGWKCLVRSKHNRKLEEMAEGERLLHDRIRAVAPCTFGEIHLRSRPGLAARDVALSYSFLPVTLPNTARSRGASSLKAVCVRVWEEPSEGVKEPIEWILLTTLPVESPEDARRMVELYRHRWLVEEYHKCLKTGCKMESRHLHHRDKLLALLGVLSIVAVMLLQFKTPCQDDLAPPKLVELVRQLTRGKQELSTPAQLLRGIAMVGGFLGRKGDKEPGWQTIWYGWTRIQDILLGIQIAEQMKCV